MPNLVTFDILKKKIESTYLMVDEGVIKLICATVIANRLHTVPVWLIVVGPSGGGKTEFINIVKNCFQVHSQSTLTPQTFLSGQTSNRNTQTSLLSVIGKTGILLFKDMTTLLSMNWDARTQIMSQLREIYDGRIKKTFGTGMVVEWPADPKSRGYIGFIGASTDVIYNFLEMYKTMGERFILYYPEQPDRFMTARKATSNIEIINKRREEIGAMVKEYLDGIVEIPAALPKIPYELNEDIIALAEFSTRAQGSVTRDLHSPGKEIIEFHDPTMPTRVAEQMTALACAFSIMNKDGVILESDKKILYKIAMDSMSRSRHKVLTKLTEYSEVDNGGLAEDMNIPANTTRRWLQDLNVLGLVDRVRTGRSDHWRLKQIYKDLMTHYEGIVQGNNTLLEPDPLFASAPPEVTDIKAKDDFWKNLEEQNKPPFIGEDIPVVDDLSN